jgi:kelch-like protein 19
VVALGNLIYVIGGYDGRDQLNSVERYNTDTNVWEFVAPMSEARSALSVTALDGKIYAMGMFRVLLNTEITFYISSGGYGGQTQSFLPIVEVYDPLTNKWTLGERLTCARSGHASAVSYHQCLVHREPAEPNPTENIQEHNFLPFGNV